MLARRTAQVRTCSDDCPFWEPGGAVLPAGCALERIQPEAEWTPELAQRWLRLRDRVGEAEEWRPTSFFSTLLG
jgi:hypothetical protein